MKKILYLLVMLLVVNCGTAAANAGDEQSAAKLYLAEVAKRMENMDSYHADTVVTATAMLGSFRLDIATDYIMKPELLAKNLIRTTVLKPDGQEEVLSSNLQYIKAAGENLTTYTQDKDKWFKETIKYDRKKYSPNFDIKGYLALTKDVQVVSENVETLDMRVVVDSQMLKTAALDMMKDSLKPEEQEQLVGILDGLPDLCYTVTVDKGKQQIVAMYMDMSETAVQLIGKALEAMPVKDKAEKQQREMIRAMLANVKVIVEGKNFVYNEVKPFSIPRRVEKEAVLRTATPPKSEIKADKAA